MYKFASNMSISKDGTEPKVGQLIPEMILESDTMSCHWFSGILDYYMQYIGR